MMKDIYGRTLGMPLARYSHDSQCWRTCEDTSLWDLPMSLETLPPWGMTRGGVLFELQTPGRLTGGQEFSSLPTPKAINNENQQNLDKYGPNLGMVLMPDQYDWPMLPTPTVNDMGAGKDPQAWDEWTQRMKDKHGNGNGHGKSLEQEAIRMLPTPHAGLGKRDGIILNPKGQQDLQHVMANHLHMLPTPTARDYRDFQIEAAKHRPEATDTLNRALAHHFGVNTNRPLPDGSPSPDQRHNRLFTEPNVNDSTPDSLSG